MGYGGTILGTTDGDRTWVAQSSGTTYSLTAITGRDATHGWAVGYNGTIRITTDGGATWGAQSSASSADLWGVAFSDATHGWAAGISGAILATTNGGIPPAPAKPTLAKLKPASSKRGATVTITGTGFGAARGAGSVKFGSKTSTTYVSWSDTQIRCKVPTNAKYGTVNVTVTTAAGKSNALSFEVKR